MRRTPIGLGILFGIIGTLLSAPGTTQTRRGRPLDIQRVNGREAVAREVLVRFHDSQQTQRAPGNVPETDPERVERLGPSGLLRVRSRSLSVTALLSALASRGDVAYAEPNYVVRAFDEPTDPLWPQLWGLKNIGQAVNGGVAGLAGADIRVSEAWTHTLGSELNVVAVVDTGIDYTHPDLAPNMWSAPGPFTVTIDGTDIACPAGSHGFNAIELSCDPMDDHNHGSHVAGTIGAAGDNGIGVVGVNRVARIMGLKFLDASGSGSVGDAIRAIEFARQVKQAFGPTQSANVRILSNSWGGGGFSQALLDAINAAAAADMLFVAAAGNSGYPTDFFPTYPASYNAASIVSVAATTNTDERAWFSNYGSTTVDLGAPGVNILSTTRGNTYSFFSGTSMATPHVSGAAALVLSRCSLDTEDLKEALLSSVDPVASLASKTVTGGRLNVNSAIEACSSLPEVPGNLTATGGDRQVRLSWSAATGATSYRVKRSLTAGGPYALVAANVKTLPYIDSDLVNGTTYYYVVSAVNVLGESADSNQASAAPKTPSDLVVSSFSVPGTGGSGRPITISVTTRNQGSGNAEPSTTRLYLSDDPTVDSSDAELTVHRVVPALAAGASDSASFSVLLPNEVAVGPHYVVAKADADDVMFESQEGNNTRARYIQIGADLVVSSFTVPLTAAPGASISVLDTTTNRGGDGTDASTTRFYLSTNATIDAGDTLLADRQIPALEPAGSSSDQTTLVVPSTLARGSYYVIAEADGAHGVAETQESNNTAARPLQVGGDLLVSAFTVPAKGGADRDLALTDTTTNQGIDAVPATVTKFYLSANSQLDASDTLLAEGHAVPALGPGASHAGSTTVRIPANTISGTHYLIAKADADGAVTETDEGNNTVARSIQIGPDLIVSALTRPPKVGAGDPVTVVETTTNQGGGNAGASATHFYLSTNAVLDAADILLTGLHSVGALAAGASSTGSTTIVIPSGTAPGSYYLFAKADAGNAVAETQENNNAAVKTVTIGPDLVVSTVFVTSPVTAGATTSVTDTVLNQGGGAAGASVTRFYLSVNNMLDATDVLLPEKRDVPGLAAGASHSGTTNVTIPPGTAPGSYYVLAKADGDGSISESVETNNAAPRGIQVN
jgi:subtilisin family serine protease/uncharacterized membrane protein